MPDSPEIYQVRKQIKRSWPRNGPEVDTGPSRTDERPHQTLPPLTEHYPKPWLPEPTPEPVLVCIWDDPDAVWDDTFGFDCEDDT